MATTVTIDPTGTPYVIHGSKAAGTPSLVRDGLQPPAPGPVLEYAGTAKWIDGDAPVSKRKPNTSIGMLIRFEAASEAALKTAVTALRTKLDALTFETTIALGASSTTWKCYAGTISPVPNTRVVDTTGLIVERYVVTIPVHPNEVP